MTCRILGDNVRGDNKLDEDRKGTWKFTSEGPLAGVRSNVANKGKSRCTSNPIEATPFPHASVSRFTGPYMCYSGRERIRVALDGKLLTAMDMVNELLKPAECQSAFVPATGRLGWALLFLGLSSLQVWMNVASKSFVFRVFVLG